MPYNKIDPTKLPSKRSEALLVYCNSGSMSSIAVATLIDLGYSNVVELDGGMQAWKASGRVVTMRTTAST